MTLVRRCLAAFGDANLLSNPSAESRVPLDELVIGDVTVVVKRSPCRSSRRATVYRALAEQR
jgi:hypothetical protein